MSNFKVLTRSALPSTPGHTSGARGEVFFLLFVFFAVAAKHPEIKGLYSVY